MSLTRRHAGGVLLAIVIAARSSAALMGVDCNQDGTIDADDVEAAMRVAIGIRPLSQCPALDSIPDQQLSIDEIVAAAPNPTLRFWWRQLLQGLPRESELMERNAEITARYAGWYSDEHALFKWAGCAAFVSHQVRMALPLDVVHTVQARLGNSPDPIRDQALYLDLLRLTNTAVYEDIGWAHLAYLNGGLAEVEAGLEDVPHHELMLSGFRAIDEGRRMLRRNPNAAAQKIWLGNTLLLKHEQYGIIQDQLGQMPEWMAELMSRLVWVDFDANNFQFDLRTMDRFWRCMEQYGRHNASFTNADDRWFWITKEILPTWQAVDADTAGLHHRLDRLHPDRQEGRTINAAAASR